MWSTQRDREQAAVMEHPNDIASREYPAREIEGYRLHVYQQDGDWHVWLNTEVGDFDGLCIACGATYDSAVAEAVRVLEACTAALQGPRWFPEAS